MMSTHLHVDDDSVAGIDRDLFTYFKRTFYEVFQQEYRGSIQTRYEAFRERMLFIVGGDDPVVRPESVLQSGPKGGLNLLEIGGLGHFLGDPGSGRADQQQTFWLPEMATLIHRFSDNAAREHSSQRKLTWFDNALDQPMLSRADWNKVFRPSPEQGHEAQEDATVRPLSPAEVVAIGHDGALPGELFERCLDDLLYRASEGRGVLFALRNEVPGVMLPPAAVRETAAALYHDDLSIARYCHGITARLDMLENCIERVCLVLPWNAHSIMRRMDLQRSYPSQAESAGGRVAKRLGPESVWDQALDRCYALSKKKGAGHSIRLFDGNLTLTDVDEDLERVISLARAYTGHESFDSVPSLPDSWVWVSRELLASTAKAPIDVQRGLRRLIPAVAEVCESSQTMLEAIQREQIRIVNVSRARYNPRFRGRLIVDASAARKRLLHVAMCLAMSESIMDSKRSPAFA